MFTGSASFRVVRTKNCVRICWVLFVRSFCRDSRSFQGLFASCTSNILISNVVPVSFHESLQLDMCDLGCTSQIHWNSPYLLVEFQCLLANISVEFRVVPMKSQFLPPKSFQKWHIPSPWPCPPQHRHGLRGLRGTAAWKRWNKNILDCAVVIAKCFLVKPCEWYLESQIQAQTHTFEFMGRVLHTCSAAVTCLSRYSRNRRHGQAANLKDDIREGITTV